jgi:NAD(P)-dependent dehydrogenase (short-subunit alcohol dehydrogenase family)
MSEARGVAFVTGASRGIGKAIAVHLARAGYDVALGARTVREGETREHSSTVKQSDTTPLPGSLESTAALVEAEGRRAMSVYLDITDRTTLGSSVTTVLERWGRIDVLVNNARYIGPGHMDVLLETPPELLDKHLEGNVMAPIILSQLVLPQMIERGHGVLMTITSGAGHMDPPQPAGQGGWGLGYGMSKAAVTRLAGIIDVELRDRGILAYNLHPGLVITERMVQDMGAFGIDMEGGAPPDAIGAAAAWLATSPDAEALHGQWIEGQNLCADLGLLPGWDTPAPSNIRFDDPAG